MSVLFNIADKITASDTTGDYLRFRKRVLADGGTITDDAQLRLDMEFVEKYKPSWFASPAVRKTEVLYGAPNLDGTVTRTTTKTGINSDGLIGTRVAGELPWSYKDDRISFLPESSRTNLFERTEEFDNAYWTKNGTGINTAVGTDGVEANVAVAPDGTMTADRINFLNQSDADFGLNKQVFGVAGQTFTTSFFVKGEGANIGKKVRVRIKRGSGGTFVGDTRETTLTGDWQRLDRTITLVTDNVNTLTIVSSNTDEATDCLIWGAQLEEGSFASSYIKNVDTVAGVTRNADVLTVTGASDVIGQESGWVYAEVDVRALNSSRLFFSTGTERIRLGVGPNNIIYGQIANDITKTISVQGLVKILMTYNNAGYFVYVNGVKYGASTATLATVNKNVIALGGSESGVDGFANDPIFRTAIGKGTLTEQQAIEITTL
jgi:hypothetical protein